MTAHFTECPLNTVHSETLCRLRHLSQKIESVCDFFFHLLFKKSEKPFVLNLTSDQN